MEADSRALAPSNARKWRPTLGAWPTEGGTCFRVWAPAADVVELVLEPCGSAPRALPLARQEDGTFRGWIPGVGPGARYRYRVDGKGPYPVPASRFQPAGVHGPSEVVVPAAFVWSD
jgi:maltooligosyltrehalose trehalohydrolase